MPSSLSHVTISAADFGGALAFYDAVLGALGLQRVAEYGDEEEDGADVEAAGWASERGREPVLWLVAGPRPTAAAHVSFDAPGRAAVDAFYAAGLAHGGRSHDAPRRWVIYRRGRYGAQLRDPHGNVVEAVAVE